MIAPPQSRVIERNGVPEERFRSLEGRSRVAHPLQSHRKPGSPPALLVGWKGWFIERSETAVHLRPVETSKVEVE
jgi:hypothetical protein